MVTLTPIEDDADLPSGGATPLDESDPGFFAPGGFSDRNIAPTAIPAIAEAQRLIALGNRLLEQGKEGGAELIKRGNAMLKKVPGAAQEGIDAAQEFVSPNSRLAQLYSRGKGLVLRGRRVGGREGTKLVIQGRGFMDDALAQFKRGAASALASGQDIGESVLKNAAPLAQGSAGRAQDIVQDLGGRVQQGAQNLGGQVRQGAQDLAARAAPILEQGVEQARGLARQSPGLLDSGLEGAQSFGSQAGGLLDRGVQAVEPRVRAEAQRLAAVGRDLLSRGIKEGEEFITRARAMMTPSPTSGLTIAPKGRATQFGTQFDVQTGDLAKLAGTIKRPPLPKVGMSPLRAGTRQFAKSALDSVLAAPSVMTDMLRAPVDLFLGETGSALRRGETPEPALGKTPTLTSTDIKAGLDTATKGGSLAENQEKQERLNAGIRQQFPVSTGLGGAGGTIAPLIAGRLSSARTLARKTSAVAPAQTAKQRAGFLNLVRRVFKSRSVGSFKHGVGRTGETAFEATVLSALSGGNPVETAAFAAGGQAAGSLSLTAAFKHPVFSAATLVGLAGLTTALQVGKTVAPGGNNYILQSIESAFDKMTIALAAGLVAGVAGTGRVRGRQFTKDVPEIADMMTSVPRASWISMFDQRAKGPEIDALAKDMLNSPERYTEKQVNSLVASFRNGNLDETAKKIISERDQ